MHHDQPKTNVERAVADSFLSAYNTAALSNYHVLSAARDHQAPDFICRDDRTGRELRLEITSVYYDATAARTLWDLIRGKELPTGYVAVNPEDALVDNFNNRLREKWEKDYGACCLLLVHVDGPLTTVTEFQSQVLQLIQIPGGRNPFQEIYARLSGKNGEPETVWWQLIPERRRFFEQVRDEAIFPR